MAIACASHRQVKLVRRGKQVEGANPVSPANRLKARTVERAEPEAREALAALAVAVVEREALAAPEAMVDRADSGELPLGDA